LKTSYAAVSTKDAIMDGVWHYLLQYYQDMNFPWLDGWMGFTDVRFNRYEEGTRMRVHCDHIHSMFDGERKGIPTISVLGALNDDYEGGELLFWESKKIALPAGSLAIFPSNFLYPHEVLPVTKGVRHSFVSWAW
jgi:predicted 2-oxoglutarate/Fe(II)-dependent dioxygenase YbiX